MNDREKRIAVIGAGVMGKGIIRNLQKQGFKLHLYNRKYERSVELATSLDAVFRSAGDAVKGVKYVISCVSDDHASNEVWFGEDGAAYSLEFDCYCIEMSTLSLNYVEHWKKNIIMFGGIPLDCPVTGSKSGVENGTLTIFIGGAQKDIDNVSPVLNHLGKEIIRIGNTGDACKFKLVYNMLSGTILVAFAEALGLAKTMGIDLKLAGEILSKNGWSKQVGSSKGERMISDLHGDVHCSLSNLAKDLHYAVEAASSCEQMIPVSKIAAEMLSLARNSGWGDLDMSAIGKLYNIGRISTS
ncbi:NAD-binding of NADP-dependent 3-hydroxyisobutyrate dehydrogenase [Fontibacillus panacisegetis]|uniref:NAD-binding of NADP-dependent 3-hydroxyisobutyrate dehydrogenase n=1 Tax=Fontibacillus panacisegetis TaxID=670482 RepID=A0A1G7PYE4_9BACL|nr:NAD(P)-dependent oxidoreductase [Fontibacillus panacisegetis]SDF91243.1 NAD-binding of NADP-dependent 3-hydroxyisobutyrate dehydrogenase [Fontibacillus panacisegetis]